MRRSVHSNVWHNCTRCGIKTDLGQMKKQRGVLVCTRASCYDTSLVGERDLKVMKAIEASADSKELQPHPVLTETGTTFDEEVFF